MTPANICGRVRAVNRGARSSCSKASAYDAGGRTNARHDAGSTEQDEAAQNDDRAVPPVDPPAQHQQADAGHGDHGHDRSDGAEQGALQPLHGGDDGAGAVRV